MINQNQFAADCEAIDAGHFTPTQLCLIPVGAVTNGPIDISARGNTFSILGATLRPDLSGYLVSDLTARIWIRFSPSGVFLPFSLNPAQGESVSSYAAPFSKIQYIIRPTEAGAAGAYVVFLVGLGVNIGMTSYNGANIAQTPHAPGYTPL